LLFLPVVVRFVEFFFSGGLGLEGLATQLLVLYQFFGDFVVLLNKAIVVIVKRPWQTVL
jgi:hypothetical protein